MRILKWLNRGDYSMKRKFNFKLNNKGMTLIEIVVCFVLVSFISVALFGTVAAFNTKRSTESVKVALLTYRNEVTRVIENDLVQRGLSNVVINGNNEARLYFRDGYSASLSITDERVNDDGSGAGADKFSILYDKHQYVLPDVGSSTVTDSDGNIKNIKDLRFSIVKIENDDSVFLLYISFYHPELGTDYSINIVAPINYISSSAYVEGTGPEEIIAS